MSILVGEGRNQSVEHLVEAWRDVVSTRSPHLVSLIGEPGFGKTRIVHEFYSRVAAAQEAPTYWPPFIDKHVVDESIGNSIRNTRKLVYPEGFETSGKRTPEYIWLGTVLASDHSIYTDSSLDDIVSQLSTHLAALLRKHEYRKKLVEVAKSAVGLVPLVAEIEAAFDVIQLASSLRELFQRTPSGSKMSRDCGYEERLAALYRMILKLWEEGTTDAPPMILVIEDFHAAHEPTVTLIQQILTTSHLPFLIITCSQEHALAENKAVSRLVNADSAMSSKIIVEKLNTEEMSELATMLLPNTPDFTIEHLIRRADGNPYSLKLQLLSLTSHITDGKLDVSSDYLAELPAEIDEVMFRLWRQLPVGRQRVLSFLALIGQRAPASMDRTILEEFRDVTHAEALESGWVQVQSDFRTFLELIRWELARNSSHAALSLDERRQAIGKALKLVIEELSQEEGTSDSITTAHIRVCLQTVIPEALRLKVPFSRIVVAKELVHWARSLIWNKMYSDAVRVIAPCLQILDHTSVRRSDSGLELLCQSHWLRCEATRLSIGNGAAHQNTIESAQEFLEWAQENQNEIPKGVVLALLQMSQALRIPELHQQSQEFFERAECSYANERIDDALTQANIQASKSYWLLRQGLPHDAVESARKELALLRTLFDDDDPRIHGALYNLGFYTRRVDKAKGVDVYREVLRRRLKLWGTDTHPIVANQQRNLAAALLGLRTDSAIQEAISLLEKACASLKSATGSYGSLTIMGESLLGLALVRGLRFLPDDKQALSATKHRALELATGALERLRTTRPKSDCRSQRLNLAHVKVACDDLSGFQELESLLSQIMNETADLDNAPNLRWQAEATAAAYREHGMPDQAEKICLRYQLD